MTQPQQPLDPRAVVETAFVDALKLVREQYPALRSVAVVMDWHEGSIQELSAIRGVVVDEHGSLPVGLADLPQVCNNIVPGLIGLATRLLGEMRSRFVSLQWRLSEQLHAVARAQPTVSDSEQSGHFTL